MQVRPFSAIKQVYGESDITAYGGVAAGGKTATFPATEFDSYVPVSDHPEYPSASACFCAALGTALKLWFDTNELNAEVRFLLECADVLLFKRQLRREPEYVHSVV